MDEQNRLEMFNEALELVRTNDYNSLYSSPEERIELAKCYAEMFGYDLQIIETDAE